MPPIMCVQVERARRKLALDALVIKKGLAVNKEAAEGEREQRGREGALPLSFRRV